MEKIHWQYIKIPVEVLDDPTLSPAEFRIILHIIRKTYGFQKQSDGMSFSQISEATGLSRRTVIDTVKRLQDRKMISLKHQKKRNGAATFNRYKLGSYWNFTKSERKGVVQNLHRGSAKSAPTILELQQTDDDREVCPDCKDPTSQAIRYAKEHFEAFIGYLLEMRGKSSEVKPVEDMDRYRISVMRGLDLRDDLTIDNAYRFFSMNMEMEP
jgi:phage replication O-like protein O